jgi:hypothetical protein
MLDIFLVLIFVAMSIGFTVVAIQIAIAIRKARTIFQEFGQSMGLGYVVLLYPLGPFIYLVSLYRLGWIIAFLGSVACYVPGYIIGRYLHSVFARAGTDRVFSIQQIVSRATNAAILGIVFSLTGVVFSLVPEVVS